MRETSIEFPEGTDISGIKVLLVNLFPSLEQSMNTIIVAMNHEFAFDNLVVPDGAEIALFPPVSGGGVDDERHPIIIDLVDEEVDTQVLLSKITLNTTGAACFFTGIVRGETSRGKPHSTDELEYEAYGKMAQVKMNQIAQEIRQR
jgi:molybdopterin synthase catalytic subunit